MPTRAVTDTGSTTGTKSNKSITNPMTTKIIWNNDLLSRYQKKLSSGLSTDDAWEQATQDVRQALEKEAIRLDKLIDGKVYLIGFIQKNGTAYPAARNLQTANVGIAVKNAVQALSQNDSRITLYIAEDELVISQYVMEDMETPSVFAFRSVSDKIETEGMGADELAECSSSLAPLVRRVHRWKAG